MTGVVDPAFWRGKRVLLTGHTGFKGSWCALWLARMGADVTGLSLAPERRPNLFEGADVAHGIRSCIGDVRERARLDEVIAGSRPQVVLHMAARALVRRALREPVETISTNVLGTAYLLEALRHAPGLACVLVVTTDKVYANDNSGVRFHEDFPLGGSDPYGASKAATEHVVNAYAQSYFADLGVPVATARGGNVIGGGDYAEDRLVPDIVHAIAAKQPVVLRYPEATRPWQHVLDCLAGYLVYVQALDRNLEIPRALNIGPADASPVTVREIAETLLEASGATHGWERQSGPVPREAEALQLDSGLARRILGWRDQYPGRAALDLTASWYRDVANGASMRATTLAQIDAMMACACVPDC
jgi:CDP-glucose 4,6-dehydratase